MASGGTRQPAASDMLELEWDEELARLAQAHADQCKFRSSFCVLETSLVANSDLHFVSQSFSKTY